MALSDFTTSEALNLQLGRLGARILAADEDAEGGFSAVQALGGACELGTDTEVSAGDSPVGLVIPDGAVLALPFTVVHNAAGSAGDLVAYIAPGA